MDIDELEAKIFVFLTKTYRQRADTRQQGMGLQYMEAETHDLACQLAKYVYRLYIASE
jgi:hypothetical protein